jgi:Flp pilus assembly protein TadD
MAPADLEESVRLGIDHLRHGRFGPAEALLQQVIDHAPNHAKAMNFLGLLYHQTGRSDAAVDLMYKSIIAAPNSALLHNNLGSVLGGLKRTREALAALDKAIVLDPTLADAEGNRALALEKLHRFPEAETSLRRALQLRPDRGDLQMHLGGILAKRGEWTEATVWLRGAVSTQPGNAEARRRLGDVLRHEGLMEQAAVELRRAVELQPRFPAGWTLLGVVLFELGRNDEAMECFNRAIEQDPHAPSPHWNMGLVLLQQGEFNRGWLEYEWRQHLKEDASQKRGFRQPAWNGMPIAGRTILVLTEQGLGDTLQFIRYVPRLKEMGAKVLVECRPPLRSLLESMADIDQVIARGEPLPRFDMHVRLMSLPGIFGTRLESIPATVPYLHAEASRVEQWRRKLGGGGAFKIGIAWQGNPKFPADKRRSIPLACFAPLSRCPGVRLFSLQKGAGIEQLDTIGTRLEVVRFTPALDEVSGAFRDTAAVMMNLDLVITSDTSIAHLAGALGVAVWVALPFASDWRWLRDREDSPWYPTMRLFRQTRAGDWDGVFHRMADTLIARLTGSPSSTPAEVKAPISVAEMFDKITILEIRLERLTDPARLHHVREELALLREVQAAAVCSWRELDDLVSELRGVNQALWQVEDDLRACEQAGDFGANFVALARSVYQNNDKRAELKRRINVMLKSRLIEEKSYRDSSAPLRIS